MINEQALKGERSYEFKAVYTIAILDFTFDEHKSDETVLTKVQLMDTNDKTVFFDKLTYIYLQMPNFIKTPEQLTSHFDRWLYVFKHL
jgi:hypothetical protein